jgi:hypothetical protein
LNSFSKPSGEPTIGPDTSGGTNKVRRRSGVTSGGGTGFTDALADGGPLGATASEV